MCPWAQKWFNYHQENQLISDWIWVPLHRRQETYAQWWEPGCRTSARDEPTTFVLGNWPVVSQQIFMLIPIDWCSPQFLPKILLFTIMAVNRDLWLVRVLKTSDSWVPSLKCHTHTTLSRLWEHFTRSGKTVSIGQWGDSCWTLLWVWYGCAIMNYRSYSCWDRVYSKLNVVSQHSARD